MAQIVQAVGFAVPPRPERCLVAGEHTANVEKLLNIYRRVAAHKIQANILALTLHTPHTDAGTLQRLESAVTRYVEEAQSIQKHNERWERVSGWIGVAGAIALLAGTILGAVSLLGAAASVFCFKACLMPSVGASLLLIAARVSRVQIKVLPTVFSSEDWRDPRLSERIKENNRQVEELSHAAFQDWLQRYKNEDNRRCQTIEEAHLILQHAGDFAAGRKEAEEIVRIIKLARSYLQLHGAFPFLLRYYHRFSAPF